MSVSEFRGPWITFHFIPATSLITVISGSGYQFVARMERERNPGTLDYVSLHPGYVSENYHLRAWIPAPVR